MSNIIIKLTVFVAVVVVGACGKKDKDRADDGPQPPEHSFGSTDTGSTLTSDEQNRKELVGFCVSTSYELATIPNRDGARLELGIFRDKENKASADVYIRETVLESSSSGFSFKEVKDLDVASNLTFEELPDAALDGAFRLLTNANSKGTAQETKLDLTPAGTFVLLASYAKSNESVRSRVSLKGMLDGEFMECKRTIP